MFRIGPFGAGGLMPTRGGTDARRGGDLSRIVLLLVCAGIVGVLALGFFLRGATSRLEEAGAAAGAGTEPLRPAQPHEIQVRKVDDPGDPDADLPDAPSAPPHDPVVAGARRPPKFVEDPKLYDDVEQYGREIEPRALWHLMHKAVTCDPITLRREAKTMKSAQFRKDPDALVGQAVRFTGRLFQLAPAESEKFPADPMKNPSGITDAVWGYVVDPGFKPCHFYAPWLPEGINTKDTVTIEGYFLKIYTFENASGNETQAPLLVARNLWEEPPVTLAPIVWFGIPLILGDHVLTVLEVVVLVGLMISVPAGIWYFRVERRQYAEYRQKAFDRRKRQGVPAPVGAAVGGETPGPPGDAASTGLSAGAAPPPPPPPAS